MMMGFEIILLVGVVALVIWGVQNGWNPGRRGTNRESTALEILERRYAQGEIDRDEFEQRRTMLEA